MLLCARDVMTTLYLLHGPLTRVLDIRSRKKASGPKWGNFRCFCGLFPWEWSARRIIPLNTSHMGHATWLSRLMPVTLASVCANCLHWYSLGRWFIWVFWRSPLAGASLLLNVMGNWSLKSIIQLWNENNYSNLVRNVERETLFVLFALVFNPAVQDWTIILKIFTFSDVVGRFPIFGQNTRIEQASNYSKRCMLWVNMADFGKCRKSLQTLWNASYMLANWFPTVYGTVYLDFGWIRKDPKLADFE